MWDIAMSKNIAFIDNNDSESAQECQYTNNITCLKFEVFF